MTCTIWLIAEDPTDVEIVRTIVQKRGFEVKIEPVQMPNNMTGIFRLANELEKLIATTRAARQSGDCIAVLVDAEYKKSPQERSHHERIRAICENHKDDVALVWAVQEIEAWLLADPGLCNWLGIEASNYDDEEGPKETLKGLLRHHKRLKWQGRDRAKVLAEIDGCGDTHSPSMLNAVQHLQISPCLSQND